MPVLLHGDEVAAVKREPVLHEKFGDQIPFADEAWYQGFATPYYTESHVEFRKKVRDFTEREIIPYVHEWDEAGEMPHELRKKAYAAGLYGLWPKEHGGNPPDGCDIFHSMILNSEMSRCGSGGLMAALLTPTAIALPPILAYGTDEMKERVAPPCVKGDSVISLAVTEPWVGSDLANLKTTARREGDFYIVNGQKKFITGGGYADFFTTAVRTGDEESGMMGVSLLLLEKDMPGLKIRRMKTQGWWMSYTAHLTFEDVKVPIKNLIGEENQGFMPIMQNFNMERFGGVVQCLRFARVCLEDSVRWARQRQTFGKRLIQHQVIRQKVANMAKEIEAIQAWTDFAALQYMEGIDPITLGRTTALMKVAATQMLERCAREASQILGGASYIRGGMGERIERIYREVRVLAIGGGSEEILLDLAARMAKL
jgi:alkylation response protein AidB-like acyl-CoA dehydrogenase